MIDPTRNLAISMPSAGATSRPALVPIARGGVLVAGLLLAAGMAVARAEPERRSSEDNRPNILFILSDDHRWDALGAAGNPTIHTPTLDQLAREGIYYRQATIHISQCLPSRATLLSGLPPHRHGIHSNRHQEPSQTVWRDLCARPTVASLLKSEGYHTVFVGKWHLQSDPWECGFAETMTWLPYGGDYYVDPRGLARGRSRNSLTVEGNTQEIFAADAIDFIRGSAEMETPFFLWFSPTAPHLPYGPNPPRIEALYEGKSNRDMRPPGFPDDIPVHEHWVEYYESVSHLDEIVGRLLQALEESGQRENTVVVFLGDNGYMMGERGIGLDGPNGKTVPYESSLRVPLLVAGLPHLSGTDPSQASSLDIPPTLLSVAGIAAPEEWPGRDLIAALRRGEVIDEAFSELPDTKSEQFGHLAFRSIRTHRYKFIDWEDPKLPDELYDLVSDPREEHNLATESDFRSIVEELSERLTAWRSRTRDPVLERGS
jgi:N-acetylglucosamine-6-sulfatase